MKKHGAAQFFPFLVGLLVVSASFAQYSVSLVQDRGSEITLNFSLSDYEVRDMVVNGETCSHIYVPRATYPAKKGMPDLPRMSQSVAISNNAEMGLEIVEVKYEELAVNKLVPSKGVIYRHENPADIPYTFGNTYRTAGWSPETVAFLGKPYIMRDVRGIAVYFQPVSYNAAMNKVKIATSITVKIKNIGISTVNVKRPDNTPISPAFDKIYNNHFINYAASRTRYTPVADGDKMAIICAANLATSMDPFVAWKNKKGIRTTLYKYPADVGGSGATAVQNFIKTKYENDKVTYFLLVGDHADIPALIKEYVTSSGTDQVGVDNECVLIEGGDRYADAFIGRFSASSTTDITTIVNKVLKYEGQPDKSGTWYKKATGIASDQGSPTDKVWMDKFRGVLMKYNYTTVDQIYDPGATATQIQTAINGGRSYANYMGHGNYNVWGTGMFQSPTHITALTNGDMLPIVVSVSCYNGYFNKYPSCFAEAFLKVSGKGCIIFQGAANSQAWQPPQDAAEEMVNLLCGEKQLSVGAIMFNGMIYMVEKWLDGDDYTYEGWILFGDPSLMPFTNTPTDLTVTAPTEVPKGKSKVNLTFGKTIDGRVSLYDATGKTVAGCGMVSDANSASFDVDVPNVAKVTLVVTARNCVPYEKEITVSGSSINNDAELAKNLKIQSYPNPFNATTKISFRNPGKNAMVSIYTSAGKEIVSAKVTGSSYVWNAGNQTSGLYFVRVKTGSGMLEKSVYLIK